MVPQTKGDFSDRVRDAEKRDAQKPRPQQQKGKGKHGGGKHSGGKRKRRNPAPGLKGKKSGTLSLGRGKQYHIEILPRTQLNVATKGAPATDKKTGKSRPKGKSTVKSQGATSAERKAGITDAFGSYMHYGTDKKTGKKVPYVVKVPSSKFRAVNLEVEGKNIRTLMPMKKTTKAQQTAWSKFLSIYGYPKLSNTKGDPVRFKIHKPTRGTFYRKLAAARKKVGA